MTTTEIKQQLCYSDERNPLNWNNDYKRNTNTKCNCTNCESGKHELANELLRVKAELIELRKVYFDEKY
jgi:hypothetical protein